MLDNNGLGVVVFYCKYEGLYGENDWWYAPPNALETLLLFNAYKVDKYPP